MMFPKGGGGVNQKMTLDDMWRGGAPEGPNIGLRNLRTLITKCEIV